MSSDNLPVGNETVCDFFEKEGIDLVDIEAKCDDSSYWGTVSEFVETNWIRSLKTMSDKQQAWLEKIRDDMIDQKGW